MRIQLSSWEQRGRKTGERLSAIARAHLDAGEDLEVSLVGSTKVRLGILMLPLVPVLFALYYSGRDSIAPWIIGSYVAVAGGVTLRTYFVALTDHRLVLLKLRYPSTEVC